MKMDLERLAYIEGLNDQEELSREDVQILIEEVRDMLTGRHPTAGVFTDECDHPQINKATERWNICPDCGQTWQRDLTG